jgi:DNA polymerase
MRVQGNGSLSALLAFIGDAPRWKEDHAGRPFVGNAGAALDKALDGTTLPSRADVWVTNLVRERCLDKEGWHRAATPQEIDWPELEMELNLVEPAILVPLGVFASRAFLGDIDLHKMHSIPHVRGAYTIVPCFDPNATALFTYDMHHLAQFLNGA